MEFEDVVRNLTKWSTHKGNLVVTKEYELYPNENEEQRKHLIRSGYSHIPSETLKDFKENGTDFFIRPDYVSVKIRYGENKSKEIFIKFHGIYKGLHNGKEEWGILMGEQVSGDLKDPPEKEKILKINDYLKILNHMGFLEKQV